MAGGFMTQDGVDSFNAMREHDAKTQNFGRPRFFNPNHFKAPHMTGWPAYDAKVIGLASDTTVVSGADIEAI